jgi:hypothetical protein
MHSEDRFTVWATVAAVAITTLVYVAVHSSELPRLGGHNLEAALPANAAQGPAPQTDQTTAVPAPATTDRGAIKRAAMTVTATPEVLPGGSLQQVTAACAAIADGTMPAELAAQLPTMAEVLVREDDEGRLVIAAGTHRRYDTVVNAIAAVDPRSVELVIQGNPGIGDTIRAAAAHLLAVEVPDEPIEMESRVRYWTFAEDEYQRLSKAQLHMLLMGPRNAGILESALRDIVAMCSTDSEKAASPVTIADLATTATSAEGETSLVQAAPASATLADARPATPAF